MTLRRPRSLRVAVRTVIVLAVVGAIATAAVAATGSHATSYRTAVVTRADVDEALTETGTIEPVRQATIAFPTSGTVATVAVKTGQTIATGQTLATLDTSALRAALTKAEASLAAEELTLHDVLNGKQVSGNGSSPANGASNSSSNSSNAASAAGTTTPTTAASSSHGNGTQSSGDSVAITAARRAVEQAEHHVQDALAAAQTAMARATVACATTPPTSTTSTTTATDPTTDCASAQAAVLHDLQTVATAEQGLAKAEATLSTLLASSSASQSSTPTTTPTTTPASSTVTYTAKQIASYEAAVAAAASNVAVAQQNLAQATIVSPIAGTVASVTLSPGTVVSAASTTANVVVVGTGGYEISTSVTIAQRAKLAVGDTATIVPDGSSTPLVGRVVSIGVVESTSNNTSTYAVTVGFTGRPTGLRDGASAAVTIVVAHTDGALTVPTSAVQTVGSIHTVTVITKGKPTITPVQIGTVGAQRTVITSGLQAGQRVSIADIGASIPSSNTSTNSRGLGSTSFGSGGPTIQRFGN